MPSDTNTAAATAGSVTGIRVVGHVDSRTLWRLATLMLFLGLAVAALATYRNYGITWDETLQNSYGKLVLKYYLSGLQDRSFESLFNLRFYGGAFDGLAALVNRFSDLGEFPTRHLLNAFVGLIGLAGTARLANRIGGPRAGFLAAIILGLTPLWYGHAFNNPKDIPFAAGMIWSTYYGAEVLAAMPRIGWRLVLKLGIAVGLTLGTRVGGGLVVVYMILVLAGSTAARAAGGDSRRGLARDLATGIAWLIPAGALAYAIMLACWPWAQQAPFTNPIRALQEFAKFPFQVALLFNGRTVLSTHLPWTYLPVYLAVQLPELTLALLAVAGPTMIAAYRTLSARQRPAVQMLAVALAFPFAYFWIGRPVIYDATRHFLFLQPVFAVIAGVTADRLLRLVPNRTRMAHAAITMLATAYGAYLVSVMVQLHPDEYIYYNRLVGGVSGAAGRFDLDYWGNSLRQAALRLDRDLAHTHRPIKVAICGDWGSVSRYLPPNVQQTSSDKAADFFIAVNRWNCGTEVPGPTIVEVRRMGVVLSLVKDLRSSQRISQDDPSRRVNAATPGIGSPRQSTLQ